MPLSSGTRHRADAASALLKAALSNIVTAASLLEQAKAIAEDDQPAVDPPAAPAPPKASSSVRRAPMPRAPRTRASVGGAGPVAAPSVASETVTTVTTVTPPTEPGLTFTVNPLAQRILNSLKAAGVDGLIARVLAQDVAGTTSVTAHGPVFAEAGRLVACGLVQKDGRRYRLTKVSKL